jgi:hypothetical protein
VLTLLFASVPSIIVGAVTISLLGFFIGPFFATGISVASKLFPEHVKSSAICKYFHTVTIHALYSDSATSPRFRHGSRWRLPRARHHRCHSCSRRRSSASAYPGRSDRSNRRELVDHTTRWLASRVTLTLSIPDDSKHHVIHFALQHLHIYFRFCAFE